MTEPPRDSQAANGWSAIGVAVLLHVALLGVGPLVNAHVATRPVSSAVQPDAIDVEMEPAKPEPKAEAKAEPVEEPVAKKESASPPERAGGEQRGAKVAEPLAKGDPAASTRGGDEPGNVETPPAVPPPASTGPSSGYDTPTGPPAGLPGLNGVPVWSLPGVIAPGPVAGAAPTVAPSLKPVDSDVAGHVLSGSLRKKDQDIGLDLPAGGVVATTIASAVRGSDAPTDAKATFEVRIGADGKVNGVKVVSSNAGDASTWDRIAKNAAATLASKALAMKGDAASHGAIVTVKIESKQQFPAGSKHKVEVQPVCAEEVLKEMADNLTGALGGNASGHGPINDPAVNRPAPAAENAADVAIANAATRKFCIPIGIAGKGDLSNTGAHAQTKVSSTFSVVVPGSVALGDVKPVDTRAPWSPPDPNKVRLPRDWGKWKKKK